MMTTITRDGKIIAKGEIVRWASTHDCIAFENGKRVYVQSGDILSID